MFQLFTSNLRSTLSLVFDGSDCISLTPIHALRITIAWNANRITTRSSSCETFRLSVVRWHIITTNQTSHGHDLFICHVRQLSQTELRAIVLTTQTCGDNVSHWLHQSFHRLRCWSFLVEVWLNWKRQTKVSTKRYRKILSKDLHSKSETRHRVTCYH